MASTGGNDNAAQFGKLSQELQRAAFHFSSLVGSATAFGKSIGAFRELEKQLALANVVAGGTVKELQQMEKAVRDFALTTVASAAEGASALYFLAAAGLSVRESLAALPAVMLLAQASLVPVGEVSDIVAAQLTTFKIAAEDSFRIVNLFAAGAASSQASVEKYAFALRQVGPAAASLGFSLESVVAGLDQLFNAGLRGEQAGTALRNTMLRLANPVGQARTILQKLNIAVFDSTGKMRELVDIMTDLRKAGLAESQLAIIFGTEALAGASALLEKSTGEWQKHQEAITGTRAVYEQANAQLNTLNGSLRLASNAVTELGISFGETLAPVIKEIALILTDLVIDWRELDDATKRYYITTAALWIGLGVGIKLLISLARTLAPLIGLFTKFKVAIDGIVLAMIGRSGLVGAVGTLLFNMSPLGRVLTGLTLALGAFGLAASATGKLVDDYAKSLSGAFGDFTLEPLQTFARKYESELRRINLVTKENDPTKAFQNQKALTAFTDSIGLAIEDQTAQIKDIREQIVKAEKEFTGLSEAAKRLQGAADFGWFLGFGDNPRLKEIADKIKNQNDPKKITDIILNSFADFGKDLAGLTPEMQKSFETIRTFFKESESARNNLEALVSSQLAKGVGSDEIISSAIGQLVASSDNLPKFKEALQEQLIKAELDRKALEQLKAKAQAEREAATESFITFLSETFDITGDQYLNERIQAFVSQNKEVQDSIRTALNAEGSKISPSDIYQIILQNLESDAPDVAAMIRESADKQKKNFVIFDDFLREAVKDTRKIANDARKAVADINRDFEELQKLNIESADAQFIQELASYYENIAKGIEENQIFELVKGTEAFRAQPDLLDALAGKPLLDAVTGKILTLEDGPEYRALQAAKIDLLKKVIAGIDNEQLQQLVEQITTQQANFIVEGEKERAAKIEAGRRRILEDQVRDARARQDFARQITDANVDLGFALAKLAPDNFDQLLEAERLRINKAYDDAIIKVQRDIEDEQRAGRLDPSIADDVLKSRLAAESAKREAALRDLGIRLEQAEREYQNSIREFAENVGAIINEANVRLAELQLAPPEIQAELVRQDTIARIEQEANAAIAEAEAALASLLAATSDSEVQQRALADHERVIDAIHRKRDAELEYANSVEESYRRQKEAAERNLKRMEDLGRAENSVMAGVLSELERQRIDSMDYLFEAGQRMLRTVTDSLTDGLVDLFTDSEKSFKEFLNNLSKDLARIALKAAYQSIISNIFNDILGGGQGGMIPGSVTTSGGGRSGLGQLAGTLGGLASSFSSFFSGGINNAGQNGLPWQTFGNVNPAGGVYGGTWWPFAKGGAFDNDIVNVPTLFKFRDKMLGEMGEAGPEAIVPLIKSGNKYMVRASDGSAIPLVRMPDGSLGVDPSSMPMPRIRKRFGAGGVFDSMEQMIQQVTSGGMSSGGGMMNQRPIQVNMTVNTPDAGSFKRSQTQILSQLQQGLTKAQRNL